MEKEENVDIKPHNFFGQLFNQFLLKFDHERSKMV